MKGNIDIFLQIFREKQLHVFAAALARTLFPPVPWLSPQMSHSSNSFKDNCQILILVPRTQRHNPYLKRLQAILPSCSCYSSCYTTLPKALHTAQWPSQEWGHFCFFFYFRIQTPSKVGTICSKQQMGTHALNSEAAHMDLCWRILEVPSESWEQGSTPTKRTFPFVLLSNIKDVYTVSAHRTASQ